MVLSKPVLKYLITMTSTKMSFFEQIRHTADKAAARMSAICGLMPNGGGPSSNGRRLQMGAIQSVHLYGPVVWRCIAIVMARGFASYVQQSYHF